jgi:Acyl-CoA dehydrogenases
VRCRDRELTRPWLQAIAEQGRRIGLAFTEPGQRYERAALNTRAEPDGQGCFRLYGAKIVVLGGDAAEALLVTARALGEGEDSLFWVEANAAGLTCLPYPMQDAQRGADFRFEGVSARLLAGPHVASEAVETALDVAGAALCAEAVGAMAELLRLTVEYLKTRQQFGRPIGSNQALQHRAVDMLMQVEMARSMAIEAALAIGLPAAERRRAISAARVLVAEACRFVGQQAVQLHGGIGVTHELNVSHYFKRLTMIAATFGDADWHLARYGEGLLAA